MKLAVIINPISGKHGRRADGGAVRYAHARRLIDRPQVEADVVLTTAAGHAAALAREYASRAFDVVIAWGGDGTVNEVAGPLIGTQTALAVVPSGSGDGLAKGLSLPSTADAALQAAIAGPDVRIDVGYLGERHFLNIAGIGFDAAVATAFNQRKTRGGLAYLTGSVGSVWTYSTARYRLEIDAQTREDELFLIAFANGRQYGNGIVLAPEADPRDGLLDVIVVDAGSAWRQIWRSRRLFIGRHKPTAGLARTRARTAVVSGERLICHVDGETFEASGTLAVRVAAGALKVRGLGS